MRLRRTALLAFLIFAAASCAGRNGKDQRENAREANTLKVVMHSGNGVKAIYEIAERFAESHPGFNVEVSVISGVSSFNAFLTSKFAVGDVPDILIYQSGSGTDFYARGGHLLDLGGAGFDDRFTPGTDRFCRYEGRLYALPVDITVTGLFVQMSVLWRAGLRTVPKTFDQFIESCEQLRRAGIEYPVVIGAANDGGAAAFNFQYLYQNLYAETPDLYDRLLSGRLKWTDRSFADMYRDYERIRRYANPDAVRVDSMEAVRRFAEGKAAYFIGGSYNIADIRRVKKDVDMLLVTPPWVSDEARAVSLTGVDTVISGTSASRHPDAVVAFLREFTSVNGADTYSLAMGSISAVAGSTVRYDHCLDGEIGSPKNGRRMDFMSREWLPGFKEVFKKLNQEWFAGRSAADILEELETAHRRMIAERKAEL